MSKLSLTAAATVGFLLGSRAGRAPYESAKAQAQRLRRDPRVREAVAQTGAAVKEKAAEAVAVAQQTGVRQDVP